MDNKFGSHPVIVDVGASQVSHHNQALDANMAVNSVDYNHKVDGESGRGLGLDNSDVDKVANMSQSRPPSVMPQQLLDPSQQEGKHYGYNTQRRKGPDGQDLNYQTNAPSSPQLVHVSAQKPKKGSFQITRVINRKQLDMDTVDHANEDADSIGDDFDETNTEDLSSELMDTSKTTDIDQDPSSEDTVQSLAIDDLHREQKSHPNSLPPMKDKLRPNANGSSTSTLPTGPEVDPRQASANSKSDINNADDNFGPTRFRIVKVSNERFVKGRWNCYDYHDSERTSREKSNEDLGSGNSSAASSVHYIPGVDDPNKNPFASPGTTLGESMPGMGIEAQPGQSMSQSQIPNGDYNAQSMHGLMAEKSGAHEMPSSIVQSVSQPISQHSQAYIAGGSSGASSKTTAQQDYINQQQSVPGQGTGQPTSIQTQPPQQAGPTQLTDYSNNVPSSDSDVSALQAQFSGTNLNEFNAPSSIVGSATQSSNASPSDTLQVTTGLQPQDPLYLGQADDQLSSLSGEDDHVLEGNFIKNFIPQSSLAQPLLEMVQTMQYPSSHEDESGASTVAIDNKIEQAMDLVKSHLMFAVREEVLVLKEQIKELLEKNSQLEYENSILRAAATQETLTKLSQTNPGPTQSSTS